MVLFAFNWLNRLNTPQKWAGALQVNFVLLFASSVKKCPLSACQIWPFYFLQRDELLGRTGRICLSNCKWNGPVYLFSVCLWMCLPPPSSFICKKLTFEVERHRRRWKKQIKFNEWLVRMSFCLYFHLNPCLHSMCPSIYFSLASAMQSASASLFDLFPSPFFVWPTFHPWHMWYTSEWLFAFKTRKGNFV